MTETGATLSQWNAMANEEAVREILPCCGSVRWAHALVQRRPFADVMELLAQSDEVWWQLDPRYWQEAFASHPRIGEKKAPAVATARSAEWSGEEQSGVAGSGETVQEKLRQANERYEQRFGRTYIVCATGKSAEEMLAILERRLENEDAGELREAAEQQRQITQIRLRKWLRV